MYVLPYNVLYACHHSPCIITSPSVSCLSCSVSYLSCSVLYLSCSVSYLSCSVSYLSCSVSYLSCFVSYLSCSVSYLSCFSAASSVLLLLKLRQLASEQAQMVFNHVTTCALWQHSLPCFLYIHYCEVLFEYTTSPQAS